MLSFINDTLCWLFENVYWPVFHKILVTENIKSGSHCLFYTFIAIWHSQTEHDRKRWLILAYINRSATAFSNGEWKHMTRFQNGLLYVRTLGLVNISQFHTSTNLWFLRSKLRILIVNRILALLKRQCTACKFPFS